MQKTQPSSDEQPTQELDLNGYASMLDSNGQLPGDEKDTVVHPLIVEQTERDIQYETAANQEQQETVPLVSLQATIRQQAVGLSVMEHKAASDNRSLTGKKQQTDRSYTLLLWIPLLLFIVLFISVISFR